MAFARSIREEDEVSATYETASVLYPRLEQLWEAWKWRLARGPEEDAVKVTGTNPQAYLIKTWDFSEHGMPMSITILYTFDENEVQILSVKFSAPLTVVQAAA